MSIAVMAALAASAAVAAPTLPLPPGMDPDALKAVDLSTVQWRSAPGLAGAETATLVGDPAGTGFYVVLNRFRPGHFSSPHYHRNDRYIVVLSGTWWAATGFTPDPERNTLPIRPGTFVVHPGREVHYDGARSGGEDAVVMIFGTGPGARVECTGPTAETGPGPCADARAAQAPPLRSSAPGGAPAQPR